jgi:MFS family permease
MIAARSAWSRLLRRELLILYLAIFLADTTVGYILPLFPLLALQLGASLTLIGSLTAINGGIGAALSPIILGVLADAVGLNVSLWVTAILAMGGAAVLLPFFEQTTRAFQPKV